MLPPAIVNAIESLASLPGIGHKSAERLVFSLLKNKTGLEKKIAENLGSLKEQIGECDRCHHYCEVSEESGVRSQESEALCPICDNDSRDHTTLCVVEDSTDLVALEKTHQYHGVYHVLHGVISPLNKVTPEDLRIASLLSRIDPSDSRLLTPDSCPKEIILALSGDMEAEATALYLYDQFQKSGFSGTITRLSRGIPSSSHLEYLDVGTLTRAMNERRVF